MDRDEFMELVYETFADEPDNVLANGIIEAADAYAEHEKAQLSKKGTTYDLISRTETVERLRGVLDVTVPIADYDGGYVDGVEVGISTVSTMPTIQPQSTTGQLKDGARSTAQSTDLIDRQAAIDGLDGHYIERRNLNDWQAGWNAALDWMGSTYLDEFPSAQFDKDIDVPSNDTISRQAAIDAINSWRGRFSEEYNEAIDDCENSIIELPPIQPEPQEGHWIPHESPDDGEQYECSRCGVLWEFNDGTPEDNEAYFCPKCGKKLITK